VELVMAVAWADEEDVSRGEAEPVSLNQRRSESAEADGEVEPPVDEVVARPLSVLVADDEAALRRSVSAILEGVGYRVVEAEDGQVALDLLQVQAFDVLVLDLHMPRADGVSMLRQIEVPPPIVIIYSAFAYFPPEAVRAQVGAKVFRYLQKPVPPRELIAVVNEAAAELDH
jgi:CheY-like chemotaxis protein